jgi:hypothetical protein
LQCVLAAKIFTVDFVVCTLAVKKESGQVSICRIGPFPSESQSAATASQNRESGPNQQSTELAERQSRWTLKSNSSIADGRGFAFSYANPGKSLAAALRYDKQQPEPQTNLAQMAAGPPVTHQPTSNSGQSTQAPNLYSLPVDNVCRVATSGHHILIHFNGDVLGEAEQWFKNNNNNNLKSNETKCIVLVRLPFGPKQRPSCCRPAVKTQAEAKEILS